MNSVEEKHCNKCGKCCRGFHITTALLSKDLLAYYNYHEGVEVIQKNGKLMLRIHARCLHLTENNLCDIYNNRPRVCKDGYTKNRQHVIFPEECGLK